MKTKPNTAENARRYVGRTVFKKLVRDGVPAHVRSTGATVKVRKLRGKALVRALFAKITEEKDEIAKAWRGKGGRRRHEKLTEELADLLETLGMLTRCLRVDWQEVLSARMQKLDKRGAFNEGYFLEWTEEPKKPKK